MKKSLTYARVGIALPILLGVVLVLLVHPGAARSTAFNQTTLTVQEKPFDQAQALADLRKTIADRKTKPASEVFKNIQMFKQMPAQRLLAVMEIGYAKSLGVNCTHCHVPGEWEKDDKPAKQITRDMSGMVKTINSDLLKNIKNLKGPNPTVNCTTCHRGQVKPALDIEDTPKP